MTSLLRYDAARAALAEAKNVDEVKNLLDWSARARLYAQQAANCEMEADAIDIRERAERELGLLLIAQKEAFGLAKGGRPKTGRDDRPVLPEPITLADLRISKDLSSRAQKKAGIAEQAFEAMVARQRERILTRGAVDIMKDVTTAQKQERRANHERVLGAMQCSLPDIKAGVILEDFEWHFETRSEAGMDRHAANHYVTAHDALTPEDIVARTAERFAVAARDCVNFMWATNPHLSIALQVMALRGFDYKSNYCWGKDKIGSGYWNREKHELLLIGVKGHIPCPAPGTQWESLVIAPRAGHSEKPDTFYEMIESYFPTLPKLELNARRARTGWISWGNEAPETVNPQTGEIVPSEAA